MEFKIINLQNTMTQISQPVLSGVASVFCTASSVQNSTSYSFQGGYFSQDFLYQYSTISGVKS